MNNYNDSVFERKRERTYAELQKMSAPGVNDLNMLDYIQDKENAIVMAYLYGRMKGEEAANDKHLTNEISLYSFVLLYLKRYRTLPQSYTKFKNWLILEYCRLDNIMKSA